MAVDILTDKGKIRLEVSHKTIYTDIVGMPDPLLLGMTIRYYNNSDVTLYMQAVSSGVGWSGSTVNLGSLATGLNAYVNLDNFVSRTKPASPTTETIRVTLNGYSDAGYTTLVYTFSRDVTVVFIKSDDGTWTTDFSDNFDDGTVDGWAVQKVLQYNGGGLTIGVVADYKLSNPYALRADGDCWEGGAQGCGSSGYGSWGNMAYQIYKAFTTPNKTSIYAIFNIRITTEKNFSYHYSRFIKILEDVNIKVYIGDDAECRNYADPLAKVDRVPINKWMRIVVSLTPNATVTLKVLFETFAYTWYAGEHKYARLWLDDFKIISK